MADPDAAARKLVKLANAVEPVQDGRIYIDLIRAHSRFVRIQTLCGRSRCALRELFAFFRYVNPVLRAVAICMHFGIEPAGIIERSRLYHCQRGPHRGM